LWESERWGEPYVFYIAPEIVSWVLAVVDGEEVLGGLSGGEVVLAADDLDVGSAVNYLVQSGYPRGAAGPYVLGLPRWSQDRVGEACSFLYRGLYVEGPLRSGRMERNRENARQQREISEDVQERKLRADLAYPFEKERMLLSLMRVGDRRGARSILNDMLAALFLRTPRLITLKMRVVEMLGYLVRVAVEDNPLLRSLLDLYPTWTEQILAAPDFEMLCIGVRNALDELTNRIFLQGHNRRNGHVERVLHYLAEHYTEPVRIDEIARAVGVSKYHLLRLVKRCTGKTILQHVKGLRVEQGCRLLTQTDRDYADIAYELGFADQSHFIKQFRELTGTTPARFRREHG
jgi:two-component system response regulator YesN